MRGGEVESRGAVASEIAPVFETQVMRLGLPLANVIEPPLAESGVNLVAFRSANSSSSMIDSFPSLTMH